MIQFDIQTSHFDARDIAGMVAIHRTEIAQGFLSSLGDRPLGMIFSLAAESTTAVLVAARDTRSGGQVCGFALGTLSTGVFYREFFRKKALQALIVLAPRLLSLHTLRRGFETLTYSVKAEDPSLPKAELFDLAVARGHQGSGLAQLIFREFSNQLRIKGVDEFRITTGQSLERAQNFYERLGARKVGSLEVHRGSRTLVYAYTIPGGSRA